MSTDNQRARRARTVEARNGASVILPHPQLMSPRAAICCDDCDRASVLLWAVVGDPPKSSRYVNDDLPSTTRRVVEVCHRCAADRLQCNPQFREAGE